MRTRRCASPFCCLARSAGYRVSARQRRAKERNGATFTARSGGVAISQTILLLIWKTLPNTRGASFIKLAVFVGALLLMTRAAYRGVLPRTRPIVPGESMVAD